MPKTNPLTPEYGWSERASRYYNLSTGRFVSTSNVKTALEGVVTRSQANVRGLSQALLDGDITLAEWRAAMMSEVKVMHVASSAAARGGWAQMSQGDWGYTGNLVKKQYAYLERFAQDIASGKQKLDGRLLTRAGLYAEAPRGSFAEMFRRMMTGKGMTEERRVLGAAEHCDGCLEQAGLGWQPINTLDPIGAEECRTHCQCEFEYK